MNINDHPAHSICGVPGTHMLITRFCSIPWWTRVWVAQEVAVARNVLVVWGSHTFDWGSCTHAIDVLENYTAYLVHNNDDEETRKAWEPINTVILQARAVAVASKWYKDQGIDLKDLLYLFWGSGATDPRDKVYALLGLARDSHPDALVPDYSLKTETVYGMVIKDLVTRSGSLDALMWCSGPTAGSVTGTPTWATDWASQGYFPARPLREMRQRICDDSRLAAIKTPEALFYASGLKDTTPYITYSPDCLRISLLGICVDVVGRLSAPVLRVTPVTSKFLENWQRIADERGTYYVTGETIKIAFTRTIFIDQVQVDVHINDSIHEILLNWQAWLYFMRIFMTSKKGYMGLVPRETEEGDLICIVKGGWVPLILRKKDDYFLMIGEAYVHGAMYGGLIVDWNHPPSPLQQFEVR